MPRMDHVDLTTLNINGVIFEVATDLLPFGPALYETMVFADGESCYTVRCKTRDEAVTQHQHTVEKVKAGEITRKPDAGYWGK